MATDPPSHSPKADHASAHCCDAAGLRPLRVAEVVLGALLAIAAGAAAGSLPYHSTVALVALVVVALVEIAGAWALGGAPLQLEVWLHGCGPLVCKSSLSPPLHAPSRRGSWAWSLVIAVVVAWEVLAMNTSPGVIHLTLTSLALHDTVFRSALFVGWAALGWVLLRAR